MIRLIVLPDWYPVSLLGGLRVEPPGIPLRFGNMGYLINDDYYYRMPAELIVQDILKAQHELVNRILTKVRLDFEILLAEYGHRSAFLQELNENYIRLLKGVHSHYAKEAIAIFPMVRRYSRALKGSGHKTRGPLNSVCFPIHKMLDEHKNERIHFDVLLGKIGEGIADDIFPGETLLDKVYYLRGLWEYQVDIENNILFPKLIEMEAMLNP